MDQENILHSVNPLSTEIFGNRALSTSKVFQHRPDRESGRSIPVSGIVRKRNDMSQIHVISTEAIRMLLL
jgi:hypothetical protein